MNLVRRAADHHLIMEAIHGTIDSTEASEAEACSESEGKEENAEGKEAQS